MDICKAQIIMSQGDYIQNKKIILQLQRQKEFKPFLDSSFYTLSKAHSIERDISNTIITFSQLIPPKIENKCEKFITCSNTNLRPNRVTSERRMVNDYKPFVKHRKLGIYNKFCYDSSYNLINTNNTNRLFSAYSNKRLKDICNCSVKIDITPDFSSIIKYYGDISEIGEAIINEPLDKLFRFRTSNGTLIMPNEAVLGQTYSLYSLTNHTTNMIWANCSGYTLYVSLEPYDPLTNNNPVAIKYFYTFPRPIDYLQKFVLNYGITYLYVYGSDGDNILERTEFYYARIAITL